MIVRSLQKSDRPALGVFTCSDGSKHQNRVEGWIRRKAWGWARSSANNEIRILDVHGDVTGVCAFEPGEDEDSWFVRVVAITSSAQGLGYASRLFTTCLDELQHRSPGGFAYWKVDAENAPSHQLSRAVGAAREDAPPSATLAVYYVGF